MKLSDVKGERTLDVVAELIDPIYELAVDDKVMAIFEKKPLPKGMTESEFGALQLKNMCNQILKKHKKACIKIFAVIEGVSEKQYLETLDLNKLLNDVFELIGDESFRALFFSTAQSTENSSGSALESIEDQKT